MTKVLVMGDTHWGVRNDSPIFLDYFKKSVDEFLLPYIEDNNIKHIIHLGDLVDRRKYVNILTSHRLRTDFLGPLNSLGAKIHIIAGNHDEYYKGTYLVNAFDELLGERYENIKYYTTPETINIDGTDIFLLPWITPDAEQEALELIKVTPASICMAHLELEGFEFYRGQVSDHGWNHRVFQKFSAVYSGHYHHRSSRDNIHYVGAFSEHIWSDYDDPRGFSVFDMKSLAMDFCRNPFRVFHMVSYDDVKNKDIIEQIQDTDYSHLKDCYVRIVCVNKTNPFALDLLLDKIYQVQPADISIIEDVSTFTDTSIDDTVDETQDTVTILRTYINDLTLPVEKDKLIKYMTDTYHEAISLDNVD